MASTTTTTSSSSSYTPTGPTTRPSTQQQTAAAAASLTSPRKSRTVSCISASFSYTREPKHSCLEVDQQSTALRTTVRLVHSLFRFSIASAFECETRRGKTVLNGSNASCGGCHALHAAFTPKLRDDMLDKTALRLKNVGFNRLQTFEQEYLRRRLGLTKDDESSLSTETRNSTIDSFLKLIPQDLRSSSFHSSQVNFSRNATFENPKSSNRLDSHIEKSLRTYEDKLALECSYEAFTPSQALIFLQTRYKKELDETLQDMKCDLLILEHLQKCLSQLIECEKKLDGLESPSVEFNREFVNFHRLAKQYLSAFNMRFEAKLKGAPGFKELKQYLREQQPIYTLTRITTESLEGAKGIYLASRRHLKQPSDFGAEFIKAKEELSRRIVDAEIQLPLLTLTENDADLLLSHLFKIYRYTPTKDEIAFALVSMIPNRQFLILSETRALT
jgi:hypothetical protein